MKYLKLFESIIDDIIGKEVDSIVHTSFLTEGGNVFKAASWTKENPVMLTTRILRQNVASTIKYLESLTGLNLKEGMLGSTGIAESSGDIDLALDLNNISKEQLVSTLLSKGVPAEDIKKTGDSVHYKCPIMGSQKGEFVQVDFMFVPDVPFAVWSATVTPGSQFKGMYKQQLMADLTRTVNPNWKWNHFRGIIDRNSNESVFGFDPDAIAKALLGPTGQRRDLESVENILNAIREVKHEKALDVRNAYRQTLSRDPKGPRIPDEELQEAEKPKVGREFQHLEDYVYIDGLKGVKQAIEDLAKIAKTQGTMEVKWDGSPAIVFGRDDSGRFHFGDKYAKQILSTPDEVYSYFTRTSQTPERQQFAKSMSDLVPLYQAATPKDFKGFIEAGLMYSSTPPKNESNEYYFQPNTVIYYVGPKSPFYKYIANSKTGCAATAYFDNLPALGGTRNPVGDKYKYFQNNPNVVVIPPKFSVGKAKINIDSLKQIYNNAAKHAQGIDRFISPESGLTDIKNIIYKYVNNNTDTPAQVASLGNNFIDWVQANGVSSNKVEKIQAKIDKDPDGFEALFNTIKSIMMVKDDLVDSIETATLGDIGMRGELGAFGRGGEGFVYDPEGGANPRKLVKRTAFTAANRAKSRVTENAIRIGESDTAVVGWGRGMGHQGHMYLASAVITTAKKIGADPYFMLSRTVGQDDPLKPEEKLNIYRKVFPEHKNIFQVASDNTPTLPAMLGKLHEQGYKNAIVIVGKDQKDAFQFLAKPTKKTGKLPVEFDNIKVISRQETSDPYANIEGPRATPMRLVLTNPEEFKQKYPDEKYNNMSDIELQKFVWRRDMPDQLSDAEVFDLMKTAADRMGVPISDDNVTEGDNPNYFGGGSQSAIPGTPNSLRPQPNKKDIEQYQKEMAELRRFLGRR